MDEAKEEGSPAEVDGVKKSALTSEMEALLPAVSARALASLRSSAADALDELLALEKKCRMVRPRPPSPPSLPISAPFPPLFPNRLPPFLPPPQAADSFATSQVVVCIVRLCWEARDLAQLNAQVLALSKKRGQLKQAITELVQLAITFIPQLAAKADKEELVLSLKAVVDGKIYVEVERARITVELAAMREAEGRITEASETLQEVAVETFGSMEKEERVEILLEQVSMFLQALTCAVLFFYFYPASSLPSPPPSPHRSASPLRSATLHACLSSPTR